MNFVYPIFFLIIVLITGLCTDNCCAFVCEIDPNAEGARYAYGENAGWINLSAPLLPGVTVSSSALTGYAWGENVGWINFSPESGGVLNNGKGVLSGAAWGENIGWIHFAPEGGGVAIDPVSGIFSGSAWGENIGWISFSTTGAVPFQVKTSPECVTKPFDGICGDSNGSTLTTPPTSNLCLIGDATSVSGSGPWSWTCSGLFGGKETLCTASIQTWPLSVNKAGLGIGSIVSPSPDTGINCGNACSKFYAVNSIVTLDVIVAPGSRFSGWKGCDSVNGTRCVVTTDRAKSVTAAFDINTDVKIDTSYFFDIPGALHAVASGDMLQLRQTSFNTDMNFDRPDSYTVRGGYDATFSSINGTSSLKGPVRISAGKVIFENISIINELPASSASEEIFGVINVANITSSSVDLKLTSTNTWTLNDGLQYRVYYSTSDVLNSIADMEAYGTPFGDYAPVFIDRTLGKINRALRFSGIDYADAGNGAGLNFGSNSFSVEAWIYPTEWLNLAGVIAKGASDASEPGYVLRQVTDGTNNYLQFVLSNGTDQVSVANVGYSEKNWYHVVAVADRDARTLKLFVNGELVGSTDITGFSGSTDSPINLSIGRQQQHAIGQSLFYKGIIDEAAIYAKALNIEEISDRYNAGKAKSVEEISGLTAGWSFDEDHGLSIADVSGGGNSAVLHFSSGANISALQPNKKYFINAIVMDQNGNKFTYTPTTIITRLTPVAFSGSLIPYDNFTPATVDVNNDGLPEMLGTYNGGTGNLLSLLSGHMGLEKLFAPGRANRDCRIADFNGDGLDDVICNTYSAEETYTYNDPLGICTEAANNYSENSVAMLFFNNGDGTFREDTEFTAKQIRGFGETILAADFNNDGYVDIFIPYYSHCSPNEHSYLLINDGTGHFTEISDSAGVSLRNRNLSLRVEGAQAVDFNQDGWIDFYVGGHLFINNGIQNNQLTFTDQRAALGLPELFDEGAKFLDWNNDGYLDLIIHNPEIGPALYEFNGKSFSRKNIIPSCSLSESYGMNVFDINNDGREDIIFGKGNGNEGNTSVASSSSGSFDSYILLNNGYGFELNSLAALGPWNHDLISYADIDGDGKLDVIQRSAKAGISQYLEYYKNISDIPQNSSFRLDIVGISGEHNQQGRVVKIVPQNHPDVVFSRIVESGSGYMTQSPYELLVGTPYQEPHNVVVYYAEGVVAFTINPGESKRIYPNGDTINF